MKPSPPSADRVAAVRRAAFAADLHPDHEKSLHAMSDGLLRRALPDEHASALLASGMVRRSVGGLMLTDAGLVRVLEGGK